MFFFISPIIEWDQWRVTEIVHQPNSTRVYIHTYDNNDPELVYGIDTDTLETFFLPKNFPPSPSIYGNDPFTMMLSLPWLYICYGDGRVLQTNATSGDVVSEIRLILAQTGSQRVAQLFAVQSVGVNLLCSPGNNVHLTNLACSNTLLEPHIHFIHSEVYLQHKRYIIEGGSKSFCFSLMEYAHSPVPFKLLRHFTHIPLYFTIEFD